MEAKRQYPAWLRGLMCLSGASYTMLLMRTESRLSFGITAALSLGLLLFLAFRMGLVEKIFRPRARGITALAAVLSCSAVYTAKSSFFRNFNYWIRLILERLPLGEGGQELVLRMVPWAVGLAALPMAFGFFCWFLDRAWALGVRLWRESDFTERFFLLGAGVIFAMTIVFTYLCTQAFYGADIGGTRFNFDLIYSSDSGYLVETDVYRNVGAEQNDLRQPLFGLFSMPFAQMAWLLSRPLFFLPHSYVTIWQIMQMVLWLVSAILVSRMMKLKGAEKALFLVLLAVCWPTLIFVLSAEQYLLAVFYLVLLLYLQGDRTGSSVCYLAATGSLLTSGIWFPLVTWDRDIRSFVKNTAKLCGIFFGVTALCGRLTTFLDMPGYIGRYGYYSGADIPLKEKLLQFVNFAGACIVAPPSGVDFTTYHHISWQMLPVERWSPVGLVVLGMALGGLILSRRERFDRICGVWVGFSLLLLGIVGWGTVDNGLMLYTLYFGWAYAALAFRLLDRLLCRVRPLKLTVLTLAILGLSIYNAYALRGVLIFGTRFYPAL